MRLGLVICGFSCNTWDCHSLKGMPWAWFCQMLKSELSALGQVRALTTATRGPAAGAGAGAVGIGPDGMRVGPGSGPMGCTKGPGLTGPGPGGGVMGVGAGPGPGPGAGGVGGCCPLPSSPGVP